MNILVIGKPLENILESLFKSKLLDKIYTAGFKPLENIPNIEYTDFEDLTSKIKALQIDISICTDKEILKKGIVDCLKHHHLNIIGTNTKWLNLEQNPIAAKQLMDYYSINNPPIIKTPLTFPVILKSLNTVQIAHSMQDLIKKREVIKDNFVYLEDYLDGEIFNQTLLWDGKNLLGINIPNLTEVQQDRLKLLNTKLNFMLSDEKADFIGFFETKLIWAKNDWHILNYTMRLTEKSALQEMKTDFLYLLNSTIYQKLNELF